MLYRVNWLVVLLVLTTETETQLLYTMVVQNVLKLEKADENQFHVILKLLDFAWSTLSKPQSALHMHVRTHTRTHMWWCTIGGRI